MSDNPDTWSDLSDVSGRHRSLEEALDCISAGVYAVDEKERLVAVNSAALRLLACSADDLIGRDAQELLHRNAQGNMVAKKKLDVSHEELSSPFSRSGKSWFQRGDDTLLPVVWSAVPCASDTSQITELIVFQAVEQDEGNPERSASPRRTLSEIERLALLADTTAHLISNVDVKKSLMWVVELMLPGLADWVVIDLITENDEVSRSLVAHANNGKITVRQDLQGPMPPVPETSSMPLSKALRGAASTLVNREIYSGPPDTGIAVEQRKLFEVTGINTAAIAPIRGPREVLGAMTLGRVGSHHPFVRSDLSLLEDIARRIGIALENARHYQRQRQVVETMQRYLLPQLPQLSGLEMTARYLPAPDVSHVGGDWYDAFPLPGGDTALVIGDVVGHDLEAAAGMAQLRNMLRAYAWAQEQAPHSTIERLDQTLERISDVSMATFVLGHLKVNKVGQWELLWASAGHPPPLLIHHDGITQYLEEGNGILLGTGVPCPRADARVVLPPGSTLLFYTDGLVEARGQSLETGLRRMRQHAASLAHRSLNSFADHLLERARPDTNDDDAALLTVRIPAKEGDR
ncbi:SpoIIE family protein phosphatase [Nocardiopsis sp. CNT312]|uniref:SpoIIE family protein phosphatase n=1 Tax=Nocardiopsis sp. CNT312 TaxID=1137268 RepID=UPI00048F8DB0|nr:SpoIIE family protein phosphatase [Nocardiopsis sp. CNT312]